MRTTPIVEALCWLNNANANSHASSSARLYCTAGLVGEAPKLLGLIFGKDHGFGSND